MSQLLYLPLDDAVGSTVGRNPANVARPLQIQGGAFVAATGSESAYLDLPPGATGVIEGDSPVDLTQPFTLSAQIKTAAPAGTLSYIALQFSGSEPRQLYMALPLTGGVWQTLIVRQTIGTNNRGSLSVQVDSALVEGGSYPDGWGMPTGLAIYNDDTRYVTGGVSYRNVAINNAVSSAVRAQLIAPVSYNVIVDDSVIRPQLIAPVSYNVITITEDVATQPGQTGEGGVPGRITYRLNGKLFSEWGIVVSASKLYDKLERKESLTQNWADRHGEWVDLSRPRFESRQITLECGIWAKSAETFLANWQAFSAQFQRAGTQRLQANVFGIKALVYEVDCQSAIELEKKWRADGIQHGTFTLTLREPDPIKRVIAFSGPGAQSLTLTSAETVSIHWGDGTHDTDVYGTAQTISHTYAGAGTYYAIISGDIDAITNFSTSGTVLWDRL